MSVQRRKMDMRHQAEIVFWRRTDDAGLERLVLAASDNAVTAESTVLGTEDGGFRIDHRWQLNAEWRALSLEVEKRDATGRTRLLLERTDLGWAVDGGHRPDLDAAEEPDLSVTPFCNTLPIRRLMRQKQQSLTLDTCYVDAASMTVTLSRQRYDRLQPRLVRYLDLGVATGFEAELQIDDRGLVTRYEGLFEQLVPKGW